jgi:hypothetical protein
MKKRLMATSVVEKIFPKISYPYYTISFLLVNKEECEKNQHKRHPIMYKRLSFMLIG